MSVVVLIEVDELVRGTLTRALERQGHEVVATGDVRGALGWMARHRPDVVIAELTLGQGTSGPEVLDYARRRHPEALRILMSGQPVLDACAHPHVHDVYLAKPFSVGVIAATLGGLSPPERVRAA
jgi:DNA-binding NtrC family response regulator